VVQYVAHGLRIRKGASNRGSLARACPAPQGRLSLRYELTYGGAGLPLATCRAELEAYLSDVVHGSFPILPYDEQAAHWHGLERAPQESVGRPKPYVDGQLAAIARVNDLILAATNVEQFVGFRALIVEDWTKR
jgi:tRNA(fMet)-specific endonuclease VapC